MSEVLPSSPRPLPTGRHSADAIAIAMRVMPSVFDLVRHGWSMPSDSKMRPNAWPARWRLFRLWGKR